MLIAYFEVIQGHFFREVTFSIFDQRDGEKDDVTVVGGTMQVCCLKGGTDGVVSTASATTSNPLPNFVLLRRLWLE